MHRSPRKGLTKRVMAFDMLQYLLSVTCLQQLTGLARNCRSTRYICGSKRSPSSKAFLSYLLCSLRDNACQEGGKYFPPSQSWLSRHHSSICAYRNSAQESRLHAVCMRHGRWARRDTTSWNGRYTDCRHCDTKSGLPIMFQFCCCPLRLEVKWTCACLTSPHHRPARACHQTKPPHCIAQDFIPHFASACISLHCSLALNLSHYLSSLIDIPLSSIP